MDTALLGEAEGLTPSGETAERSLEGGQPRGNAAGFCSRSLKLIPSTPLSARILPVISTHRPEPNHTRTENRSGEPIVTLDVHGTAEITG